MHPTCRRLEQEWNERPATPTQLAALRRHKIAIPERLTVRQASALLAPDIERAGEQLLLRMRRVLRGTK
jgi:hypothetical protein